MDVFAKYGWIDLDKFKNCFKECLENAIQTPKESGPEMLNEILGEIQEEYGRVIEKTIAGSMANMDRQFLYGLSIRTLQSTLEFYLTQVYLRLSNKLDYWFTWPKVKEDISYVTNMDKPFGRKRSERTLARIRKCRNILVHNGGIIRKGDVEALKKFGIQATEGERLRFNINTIRLFYTTVLNICEGLNLKTHE
jgi:hypothetical protein